MKIPLSQWAPDLAALNGGDSIATNVFPEADGYSSVMALSPYSEALAAQCIGAATFRDDAGNLYAYAGTTTKLYQASGIAWTDVTNATEDYEVASDVQWEFVQWGTDQVIATAFYDGAEAGTAVTFPQVITMGGANFTNLISDPAPGTTPFRAHHVTVCRDFVVFGNVEYDSTAYPNRIWWTAFQDATKITVDPVTQSDFQDLRGAGKVQKVLGGKDLIVVCETSTFLASYVGSPRVFQIDEVYPGVGTSYPWSAVRFGDRVWLLSREGFVELAGGSVKWIGKNRVDKYFRDNVDSSYSYRVSAVKDPRNHRILWGFPTPASSGNISKILCYDYALDKWSLIEQNAEVLVSSVRGGVTIDDAIFSAGGTYADLDAMTTSLDSPVWQGGQFTLAAFDTAHKLSTFDGATLAATVDTQEAQLAQDQRSFVTETRPLVDAGTVTVALGTRNRQEDAVTWGNAVSTDAYGKTAHRSNARYHRARLTTSGTFNRIQGVEVKAKGVGRR